MFYNFQAVHNYTNESFQGCAYMHNMSATDAEKTSIGCELKAVVEFFMPYSTDNNDQTSIKFAIGNEVSVNCLIGMSFIQDAKLVIDLNDNVIESKILKTNPFPIQFMRPSKHLPKKMSPSIDSSSSTLNACATDMHHHVLECINRFNEDDKFMKRKKRDFKAAYDTLNTICDAEKITTIVPHSGNTPEF